jgi:hypothetical protein
MASQRRAPTKRPPRPVAKKPPPPSTPEGTDTAESVSAPASATTAPVTNGTTTAGDAASLIGGASAMEGASAVAGASGTAAATSEGTDEASAKAATPTKAPVKAPTKAAAPPKTSPPTPSKSRSAPSTKSASSTSAKTAAPGARPKPGTSGPNYRPPTGAARSAARRPPPPPRRKRRKLTMKGAGAIGALVAIAGLVIYFSLAINGSSSPTATSLATADNTPEQVPIPSGPILAAPDASQYPATIDAIQCQTSEQVAYHIHAHLTIFVDGKAQVIPYGIGIAPPLQTTQSSGGVFVQGGTCFYWLHTHSSDGIIHIESPTNKTYTLGQFFDEWGQPLSTGQVGPAYGKVTVFQDGKPYTGDPRNIQLTAHNQIQLDVGTPIVPQTLITFPSGL